MPKKPDGWDVLGYELLQEKAATLARLGRRLEEALGALERFDAERPSERALDERDRLVAEAGEALWYYTVQREVAGLRDTDAMMRHLRVPREVWLRMGFRPKHPNGGS